VTLEYSIDHSSFRTLLDVALRRIPTAARGQWTLHAPVDPGVTLVELLAWLLEQRSYWADRETVPLVRAVLGMFGESLQAARAAGVAVSFEPELTTDLPPPLAPHAEMPAGTPLRVPETDIVFTTRHGLTALALERYPGGPARIELEGVSGFGAEDLRSGRPIPVLGAGAAAGEMRIGLRLKARLPAGVRLPISLAFELDTTVPPEWSPEAAPAHPAAVLRWEYQSETGAWRPLQGLRDGTLGLRRSGVVRFAAPPDWGGPVSWLRIATERATFAFAPTLLRILPNSALAWHQRWLRHRESPGWLPLPGRSIQLDPGALPLPERAFVYVAEPAGRRRWHVLPELTSAGPGDRVVRVDRARAALTFGDGLTGRLPRLNSAAPHQVQVFYAAGGGARGNVPPCRWEAPRGPLPDALSFVPAVGGREAETLDEARTRASARLRVPTRAVTAADHGAIACATPGVAVARAHAQVGWVEGECGVVPGVTTVFVVPGSSSRTAEEVRSGRALAAPVADPGMLLQVREQLAAARLVGEAVFVQSAVYRHLAVRVTVTGSPADREGLQRRLSGAIRLYLDPLLGGENGTGWGFGDPVRPTALLGVAQREAGERVVVSQIELVPSGGAGERCEDLALQQQELVAVDAVEVLAESALSTEVGLR
jgi:hypothetical protein